MVMTEFEVENCQRARRLGEGERQAGKAGGGRKGGELLMFWENDSRDTGLHYFSTKNDWVIH